MGKVLIENLKNIMMALKECSEPKTTRGLIDIISNLTFVPNHALYSKLGRDDKANVDGYVKYNMRLVKDVFNAHIQKVADSQKRTLQEVYQTVIQNVVKENVTIKVLRVVCDSANEKGVFLSEDFLCKQATSFLKIPGNQCTYKVPLGKDKRYVEDDFADLFVTALCQKYIKEGSDRLNWNAFPVEKREEIQSMYAKNRVLKKIEGELEDVGGITGVLAIDRIGGLAKIKDVIKPVAHHEGQGFSHGMNKQGQRSNER